MNVLLFLPFPFPNPSQTLASEGVMVVEDPTAGWNDDGHERRSSFSVRRLEDGLKHRCRSTSILAMRPKDETKRLILGKKGKGVKK